VKRKISSKMDRAILQPRHYTGLSAERKCDVPIILWLLWPGSAALLKLSSAHQDGISPFVHQLCTNAVARDETQRHRSEEAGLERRNGTKGKGTGLNSVERGETKPGQTLRPAYRGSPTCPHPLLRLKCVGSPTQLSQLLTKDQTPPHLLPKLNKSLEQ
jgi:hypothetical protein